jgi:hypothetical protein
METKWNKYTYVCSTCDALTEVTTTKDLKGYRGWCCGSSNLNWLSVVDATIQPINEGNKVETYTVNNNVDIYRTRLEAQEKQIGQVLQNLTREGWYSDSVDKEDVLRDLCEIFGYEAKQTVRITATLNIEIDYDIPLDEVDSFDSRYFLEDNVSIDSPHGDVVIQSWNVEDSEEEWN